MKEIADRLKAMMKKGKLKSKASPKDEKSKKNKGVYK